MAQSISVAPNDKPRNVPRKVIVFHLPIGSVAPYSPTLVQQVAESVSYSLNITDLVVESRSFNKGQHAIYLFHGNSPQQSVSIFSEQQKRPARLRYTPNKKLMILWDEIAHLGFVAADKQDFTRLLMALNGTLFPGRARDDFLKVLRPDLSYFQFLPKTIRVPLSENMPYRSMTLKYVKSVDGGVNAPESTKKWPDDGFEELNAGLYEWPEIVQEIRLEIMPTGYKRSFRMAIFDHSGFLRVQLSEKTLFSIARILSLCTNGYEFQEPAPVDPQLYFDFG